MKTISPDDMYVRFKSIIVKTDNDYKFYVDEDNLFITHLRGFSVSQNIKHTIRNLLKAKIKPEEITDELYIGSLQGDYKFVRRQTSGEFYFLHHYVKRFIPELYDKYKLLGEGKYDTIEPRARPIYMKE